MFGEALSRGSVPQSSASREEADRNFQLINGLLEEWWWLGPLYTAWRVLALHVCTGGTRDITRVNSYHGKSDRCLGAFRVWETANKVESNPSPKRLRRSFWTLSDVESENWTAPSNSEIIKKRDQWEAMIAYLLKLYDIYKIPNYEIKIWLQKRFSFSSLCQIYNPR